jgi:AcrR family transcriptional regulator
MAVKKRMGPETSAVRIALMDAVEEIMRDEGYAALSARNVARRANLKYQLVFYYFETMDALLLATYRRRAMTMRQRVEEALRSERPLHALWDIWSAPPDALLTIEYIAMANHNEAVRAETIAIGEQMRQAGISELAARLDQSRLESSVFSALAISHAVTGMACALGTESALGITLGHEDARALVEWCLNRLEPDQVGPLRRASANA